MTSTDSEEKELRAEVAPLDVAKDGEKGL